MPRYRFPGYPAFLRDAALQIGHPEAEAPARRITTLAAIGNLCAQAADARPENVAGIMLKAGEFRDQLHAAYAASELMISATRNALALDAERKHKRSPTGLTARIKTQNGPRSPLELVDLFGRRSRQWRRLRPSRDERRQASRRAAAPNIRHLIHESDLLAMTPLPTVYATDEDIILRASADFTILCPKDQCLAHGLDGIFTDAWTLTSQSVDFFAYGLSPGHIVRLTQPISLYKPPGEAFAIESVAHNAVVLRRKGQPAQVGQPAGSPGLGSGVEFTILTLGPQIARASYDLNRRYGIDDLIAGRRPCQLFDPREVRDATVLTVIYQQYLEMSRGPQESADTFASKSKLYKQELDDLLARLVVHWAVSPGDTMTSQATSRFSTRISR